MHVQRSYIVGYFFIIFLALVVIAVAIIKPWSINNEKEFNVSLFHQGFSLAAWKQLKYIFFHEGLKGVLIGDDGWLFTNEEFSYNDLYNKNIQNNLSYMQGVAESLSKDGTSLVIIPVPSKSHLYSKYLGRYSLPAYRQDIYDKMLHIKLHRNQKIIDTLGLFLKNKNTQLFFKTDTHWTPEATKIIAKKISKSTDFKSPKENFEMIKIGTEEFEGDLIKYTSNHYFKPENYISYETYKTKQDSLFEDKYFPIVLVGTSYSANERWNLEGFLKTNLQRDVLNVSKDGQGPFRVMEEYLNNEYRTLNKPELIVWEVPERYLPISYDLRFESTK